MAKKKEAAPQESEKSGAKRVERDRQSQDSPLAFLEQIATLFKLRLLRVKLGVEGIDKDKIQDLETKLAGDESQKSEAQQEIGELFKKILQVDQATYHKKITLEQSVQDARVADPEIIEKAKAIDVKLQNLREKGEDYIKDEDIEESRIVLTELAEKVGVELKEDKENIDKLVHKEVGELHRLKDWVQLAKNRDEINALRVKKNTTEKRRLKDVLLEVEDFKDNPEPDKRVLRVTRGTKEHQDEADKFVTDLKRDMFDDQLERTDEGHLAEGLLNAKKQNRRQLRYGEGIGGAEKANELTILAGNIYADRLIDLIVQRELRNIPAGIARDTAEIALRSQALGGVVDAWTYRREDLKPEDVVGVIEQHIKRARGRQSVSKQEQAVGEDGEFDPLESLPEMGQSSRWGGSMRKGLEQLDELKQAGIDIGQEIAAFNEKKQEYAKQGMSGKTHKEQFAREFMDGLKVRYPGMNQEVYAQLYGSVEGMFGNEHYIFLKEKLSNMDYEGYLKYLMSYLYKVGLREGHQDFQLQIMMREARTVFANVGRKDLLEIYEAFEKTAIFHDSYFQLDREGYAKVLNSWGVEPLQVFKNKEANTLNVQVKTAGGQQLNDLSVIGFDDMMQSRVWAHRLIYGTKGEIYDADKVYDDMIVTKLYGKGDQVLRVIGEEVKDLVTGKVVAKLTDKLTVDGASVPVNLATLLLDSKYMVGTAHDMWRLDGRIANILDDVQIGSALGANKGLLTVWKIKRYAEEYGFISPYMFEALELDNFIYEVENYKDLVGAGMKELFKGKGVDSEVAAGLINDHIKRLRELRGEKFRTNYLPIEDVRLLSRESLTWEEARDEYLQREALMGNKINWTSLNASDKIAYSEQITNLHKKWVANLFSTSERAKINSIDWAKVNKQYAEMMGVESIGNTFEDFIKNFSFGRLSATVKFRGTDLQDYGGYYLKSGQVVDIYKSGLGGGATEAIAKVFGTMEGYQPYDRSGFRRFAMKEMEVMYGWDDKHFMKEVPKTNADGSMSGGKRLPNGEIMTDETGQWAHTNETKILWGKSLLQEGRMRRPRNERDIEYAAYSMVGSGTLDRAAVEEFLDLKYGGWLKGIKWGGIKIKVKGEEITLINGSRPFARTWRWLKRMLWLDDPAILWEAAWDDGKKAVGGAFKYIFS